MTKVLIFISIFFIVRKFVIHVLTQKMLDEIHK